MGEQRFCAFYKKGCKCVFNAEQGQSWTSLLRLTAKQAKEFNEGNKNVQSDAAWSESIQNARHLLDEIFFILSTQGWFSTQARYFVHVSY